MDTFIRQFRDDLIDFINKENTLPIEVKRLALWEVYKAVCEAADNAINQQRRDIVKQVTEPVEVVQDPEYTVKEENTDDESN